MPRLKVPCQNCEDRHPHCHGECEKYKKYQEDAVEDKKSYHNSLIYEKYVGSMVRRKKGKK